MGRWLVLRGLVLTSLLACGGDRASTPHDHTAQALGTAAARVNGETIQLAEVERLCRASGLSPRAALERLVAERLLAQYASEQGYGEFGAVERAVAQARVRALLAIEIEPPGSPAGVGQRRQKLERYLGSLAQQTPIRFDETAIQRAFAPDQP